MNEKLTTAYDTFPVGANASTEISDLRLAYEELHLKIISRLNPKDPRYLALAKTALEESCMWAIKSITHAQTES